MGVSDLDLMQEGPVPQTPSLALLGSYLDAICVCVGGSWRLVLRSEAISAYLGFRSIQSSYQHTRCRVARLRPRCTRRFRNVAS